LVSGIPEGLREFIRSKLSSAFGFKDNNDNFDKDEEVKMVTDITADKNQTVT
jgi:hypothetical protein